MARLLLSIGVFLIASVVVVHQVFASSITVLSQFNPPEAAGLCGLGYDHVAGSVWVYDCDSATIQSYSKAGVFLTSVPRPGEATDDVDIEFTPEPVQFSDAPTPLPAGTLLFINGESGPADIYALDKTSGEIIAVLNTQFGVSHVVGGAYHAQRDTFFLVQDRVPSGTVNDSVIAEVDPVTGSVLNTFQIASDFSVNYGDLEVNTETGNLFVVSNDETTIGEFTPTGTLVEEHLLPSVGGLSGIGLDDTASEAWVANTSGVVTQLGIFSHQVFLPLVTKD